MNHLQIPVKAGIFAVTWNSRGLLSRIDWFDTGASMGFDAPTPSNSAASWNLISKVSLAPPLLDLFSRFQAYFEHGEPLGAIPWDYIDTTGWTDFQHGVYRASSLIPHGETRPYAWVARRSGQGLATRAVGQALRKNPLPILIPCHRVVSSGNSIGGFMGINDPNQPEMKFKRFLIDLENRYLNPVFPFLEGGFGLSTASTPSSPLGSLAAGEIQSSLFA